MAFPPDPLPPFIFGGSVNILAGASGTGKTALAAQWAVALRDGKTLLGQQIGKITGIGVISADRSWEQSSGFWFNLAGWPDIPHYSLQDDDGFDIKRLARRTELMTILGESLNVLNLPWGSVVLCDPVGLFLGGDLINYYACLVACSTIRRMCRVRGITLIGAAHASKQIADPKRRYMRPEDRIAGSTALLGYSDTQFYLASPEEVNTDHYLLYVKSHHAPPASYRLDRLDNGLFSTPESIQPTARRPQKMFVEALDTLLLWLPGPSADGIEFGDLVVTAEQDHRLQGSWSSRESAERTIRRWLGRLIKDGRVERTPQGRYRNTKPN